MNIRRLRLICIVWGVLFCLGILLSAYLMVGSTLLSTPESSFDSQQFAPYSGTLSNETTGPILDRGLQNTDMSGHLPNISAFQHAWTLPLRRPLYDPLPVVIKKEVFIPPPLPYKLTGTVIELNSKMAMFISPQGKIIFRREGQKVGEATINKIEQDWVQLTYYDKLLQLDLAKAPQ